MLDFASTILSTLERKILGDVSGCQSSAKNHEGFQNYLLSLLEQMMTGI